MSPSNCSSREIDGWDGDDEISSVKNRTSCTVRPHADVGWGGAVDIPAGDRVSNLERLGVDNEAESPKSLC
ncbi:hypothetical protein FHX42_004609 [Saccharopolyspora lacisalsi]|uniref:Uncharacterized protein n=1 Tax=Halosaccharopolyspora lacisalsi TaxID=1000566 RepID=A0A839E5T3_9PSEU|nr:hypothetical protein [Halosaccharopolyspora lacisalsi]MBA8827225.1 hypothetical protein [Halosaccharopolyspora lacisalsi]